MVTHGTRPHLFTYLSFVSWDTGGRRRLVSTSDYQMGLKNA